MATSKKPQVKEPVQKKEETKKEVLITLTKDQFTELKAILWDCKREADEIEEIGTSGEDDMRAIGFVLGSAYTSLQKSFSKFEDILDVIEPEGYNPWVDEDEEEDDNF
jgi:hypothetical protein